MQPERHEDGSVEFTEARRVEVHAMVRGLFAKVTERRRVVLTPTEHCVCDTCEAIRRAAR